MSRSIRPICRQLIRNNATALLKTMLFRLIPLCALLSLGLSSGLSAYEVTNLRCEYSENPYGVDVSQPALSWQLKSEERGVSQAAWEIEVASTLETLVTGRADLWRSGRVNDDRTRFVLYGGRPLRSSQQVFWRVRSWRHDGTVSPWSEVANWTMGQVSAEDWDAVWIEAAEEAPSVLLRQVFEVDAPLKRALVHVSGLGHYELHINGQKVGEDKLSPGWTDYEETTLYDTRNVADFLDGGRNAIGLMLGNGMYHVERNGRFAKFEGSFGNKRAILELILEFEDGTRRKVVSNDDWRSQDGPITVSSIFGGETYDARLLPVGWSTAGYDDRSWAFARPSKSGRIETLRGQGTAAQPLKAIEVREPVSVQALAADGAILYDFGQNTSYVPRIRVKGPKGSRIQLIPAELVFPDGYPSRSSMGGIHRGTSWCEYIKGTDGEELWEPSFFYIGSRYIQFQAIAAQRGDPLPTIEQIEGLVVHSTARPLAGFETSNPLMNDIRGLVRWAQRSNMVSVLTDCPHREKLGWLEQYHLNGPSIRYEFDVARIFRKAMRDMADGQTEEGMVPNIAPEFTRFRGTFRSAAEWGAAFIAVPWQQYLFNGDTALMAEYYPQMKAYYGYLESKAEDNILSEGLGDWYDLGPNHGPGRAQLTLPPLTATAFLFQDAKLLGKMATLLGRTEDAEHFKARAAAIRRSFNERFYNEEGGYYASNSQAGNAIPLVMGIVEPENRDRVFSALLEDVVNRGYAMTAGDVGFRYLLLALSDAGRDDVVFRMINQDETPGYGYQLKMGATALTEAWDASPSSSNNHFMLGHIIEWFYGRLLGIRPVEEAPGFKHVHLEPRPVAALQRARGHHDTPYGRVEVEWIQHENEAFAYTVKLPPNTTATLVLPAGHTSLIQESGVSVEESIGVQLIERGSAHTVFRLTSGTYSFLTTR